MVTVYDEFIERSARSCQCCPDCSQQIPCDGVMAGGMCDELCYCDELREAEELYSREIAGMSDEDFL